MDKFWSQVVLFGISCLQSSDAWNELQQDSSELTFTGEKTHTGTSFIQKKVTYRGVIVWILGLIAFIRKFLAFSDNQSADAGEKKKIVSPISSCLVKFVDCIIGCMY